MAEKPGIKIQLFDKVSAYFQALSQALGGISKDDLKLLNPAFYVKSIEQIDSFIRNTMLLPSNQDSITRLMSHVDQASEISAKIELCERKLLAAEKITSELENYQAIHQEKNNLEVTRRLARIFPEWKKIQEHQEKGKDLEQKKNSAKASLPQIIRDSELTNQLWID